MCGILGGVNLRITPELLATIRHRGPDRQAIYDDVCDGQVVSLAHTRLSIVDLSEAGNQPMVSPDGNYVLVFNGEIYNHADLRQELQFRDWRGHSDTETLLHFLMEKGMGELHRLNGIFAFAFYDRIQKKIVLARDQFGVKPLYFAKEAERFVFASEIRPITQMVPVALDEEALEVLLTLRYVPSPYTLYKGVHKLRPGHYCVLDLRQGCTVEEPVPYVRAVGPCRHIGFEQAVEQYGQQFESAIRRQLMGDVDMGILLSGGVDSALVAGVAAKYAGRGLRAFTVGFDQQYAVNEIDMAAETARWCGLEHHVVKMDVNDFFETFAECSRIVEEPLATTSFIPMYYLARLAAQHVKVVLTGQGADEPLGGYGRYQGELLRARYPHGCFTLLNQLVKWSGIKKESVIRGARSLGIRDDVMRFASIYSLFTPEELRMLTGRTDNGTSARLIRYYYDLVTADWQQPVDKMMSVDLRMDLADDLLLYTDKVTMNFSLECRVPMLDVELVDYLETLPTAYKVQRGKTKIVHKAYAARVLPSAFVNRPKLGFQSPTDIWFREQSAFVEHELSNGRIADWLDVRVMRQILEQHRQGYNREKQIFLLLSLNEWMKHNI